MTNPKHLLKVWPEVAQRLTRPDRVGLFLDFDGTLVRIRRKPGDVRLGDGMREVLKRIARTPVLTAVVTGRGLSDVRTRVRVDGIWYAGDHGYSLVDPHSHSINLANSGERARIQRVRKHLSLKLAPLPSVVFDAKAASVAVHYRGATRHDAQAAEDIVRSTLKTEKGLFMLSGKKVWEILPGNRVDKWTAIQWILRRNGRQARTIIFVGDDVTDERVFAQMSGISVFVGSDGPTAARYRLESPGEVRQFLQRCLRLWEHGGR